MKMILTLLLPVRTCRLLSHLHLFLIVQSIIILMCLTADLGVTSLIPARSHTFMEIDHEIISVAIFLPSADSRRVVVSYK